MTVKELIEILTGFDPNSQVVIENDYDQASPYDIKEVDYIPEQNFVYITLE